MDANFTRSLIGRLIQSALVIFLVITLVFIAVRAAGDPITVLAPFDASPEAVEEIRQHYGLDEPLPVQYLAFIWNAVQLDFGDSFRTGQPAMNEVVDRLPATLQLGAGALIFSVLVGVPLGVISAVKRGTPVDAICRFVALIGQATPNFWLGLMLILVFAVYFGLLPTGGTGGIRNLILPSVALGAVTLAAVLRLTRSGMLEVMESDFIRTARSKGLTERVIIWRHAIRQALLPVLTILGIHVGRVIAGTIVIETVFSWPGIGRLMITSVGSADYPVVQAAVFVVAIVIIAANFIVDFSYRFFDPRIRAAA